MVGKICTHHAQVMIRTVPVAWVWFQEALNYEKQFL